VRKREDIMRQQIVLMGIAFVLSMVAACTNQQQALPTLISTPTAPATTEVSEQTPTTEPTRRVAPTFPPTWTPAEAEVTPVETPTTEEVAPVVEVTLPTPLEACATFREDVARNSRSFSIGESPQVFWTAVQGAAAYHIALVSVDPATPEALPGEVFADFTPDTNYTFPAELFEASKLYGWEVYPVDGVGQQMCLSLGAELFPSG
jgi:hypothetical protein